MKIAVLGTGAVGQAIADKLASLQHHVTMGSRTADNAAASGFAERSGAAHGTFATAAAASELVFLCAKGEHAQAVLEQAGAENLAGKTVVDVSNPLDFSQGFPPSLTVCNTASLAEQLQEAIPSAHLVKTFNTMSHLVMVDPGRLGQETATFVAGNEAAAKAEVVGLLKEIGWEQPLDLGDLSASRGLEAWLLLWPRLYGALGTADFNIAIVKHEG